MLRADYEDSTGNLHRHIGVCVPQKTAESEAITAYGAGSQYLYARMRFLSALWCARRHRPYLTVEDPELRDILKMLYGRVEIPTRMTVSRDVQFILGDSKKHVIVLFKVSRVRLIVPLCGANTTLELPRPHPPVYRRVDLAEHPRLFGDHGPLAR